MDICPCHALILVVLARKDALFLSFCNWCMMAGTSFHRGEVNLFQDSLLNCLWCKTCTLAGPFLRKPLWSSWLFSWTSCPVDRSNVLTVLMTLSSFFFFVLRKLSLPIANRSSVFPVVDHNLHWLLAYNLLADSFYSGDCVLNGNDANEITVFCCGLCNRRANGPSIVISTLFFFFLAGKQYTTLLCEKSHR